MALTKATLIDLNSNELALDLDGDTTLHSSTDDQIDIKIAGADDFTFTANAFNALAGSHITLVDNSQLKVGADTDLQIYHDGTNSYIANKTGALKIATETSGIAITIGHTTSEVTIADNVTVTGNINVGGTLTFVDGSIAIADLDIDGGTDIGAAIVDADLFIVDDGAGGTNRKTAASRLLTYAMAGTLSEAAQTNITSLGTLTALTVDDVAVDAKSITMTGSSSDTAVITAGTNGTLSIVTTDAAAAAANIQITADGTFEVDATTITLDSAGDIILDADGGDVFVKDAGTTFGSLTNTSGNLIIKSGTTTAATFSGANVTFAGTIGSGAITSTGIVTGTGFTAGSAVLAEAELELLDGLTAGTAIASKVVTTDANIDTSGQRNLTISGELDAATGDFSGAVDVAGALTTAAITASGIVTGTAFTAGSAVLAEAELELLDGLTAGTAIASKVVTTDANIDTTGQRNLTISGELDAATGDFSGAVDIAGALVTHDDFTLTGASTGAVWDSSNNSLDFADSTQLRFGASADLKIYHDGSNSYINDAGTGNLKIGAADLQFMNAANSELMIQGIQDGAVTLYHNNVAKIATTSAGIDVTGTATFTVADNSNVLTLISTDADAASGPTIRLFRDSATAADGDNLGFIKFDGKEESDGGEVGYLAIQGKLVDSADGAVDGALNVEINKDSSGKSVMFLGPTEAVFNEDSADIDFRVESNGNANMLFVDGGNDRIGVGTASPSTALHLKGGGADNSVGAPIITIQKRSAGAVADGQTIGGLSFVTNDDGVNSGSDYERAKIIAESQNTSSATRLEFWTGNNSADIVEHMRIIGDGTVVINGAIALGDGLDGGTANRLDDYEEGSYTPTFTVNSGSLTVHSSHNTLAYTKIGRMVYVQGEVRFSAVSSPSGSFSVSAPFAVADLAEGSARFSSPPISQSGFGGTPDAIIYLRNTNEGTTTFAISTDVNGGGSSNNVNANQISTSTELIFTFAYIAA